ncbi:MAG: hypothetical protein WCT01_02430 [Candidatus Shapirobacteria bacterium]
MAKFTITYPGTVEKLFETGETWTGVCMVLQRGECSQGFEGGPENCGRCGDAQADSQSFVALGIVVARNQNPEGIRGFEYWKRMRGNIEAGVLGTGQSWTMTIRDHIVTLQTEVSSVSSQ